MRIAFVNDTFLQGRGADSVIYELAKRLGKKHEVSIVTSESDIFEEDFKIKKLGFGKLVTGTFKDFLGFTKLKKIRQACKNFDVINLHHSTISSAFLGLKNVVITYHGSPKILKSEENLLRGIFRFLANWFNVFMLNFIPKTIAISQHIKENSIKKGVRKNKIRIIYNGVSDEFRPKTKNNDRGYMLYVGRLEPHKSVHELIKLSKEADFPLHIAGSGPIENKLKDYAERINADKVIFMGRISRKDLIKQYQECSFFISASKWEGFGLIFIEAAACSKPSIGYNKGSIPEVIRNNKTGFIVKNYKELKQKAETLIRDKKLKKKMGKEAINFSKNFSWEKSAKEYLKVFELSK